MKTQVSFLSLQFHKMWWCLLTDEVSPEAQKVMWGAAFKWDACCPVRYPCFFVQSNEILWEEKQSNNTSLHYSLAVFFRVGRRNQVLCFYTYWLKKKKLC